jgi:phosphoribosylformylglycinamidine (FGAM) synthase PurS component
MSLLLEAMEDCVMLDKKTEADGYGGYTSTYQEGAEFQAAITFNSSIEAKVAEKQGVSSVYTVTTEKALTLMYHDVFKRVRDGKIFRVTSDGDDKFTPSSASLNMRQVSAEEWSITDEQGTSNK